jgi:hypothetical protein
VLVLGPSVHPKNAREITFQPFVDIVDTIDLDACDGWGHNYWGFGLIWKFLRSPGVVADGLPRLHL